MGCTIISEYPELGGQFPKSREWPKRYVPLDALAIRFESPFVKNKKSRRSLKLPCEF